MIGAGSIYADGTDSTARADGKRGGAPWYAITSGISHTIGTTVYCPANATDVVRVSYEARARRTDGSSPSELLVGTAVVTNSGGSAVISESVETSIATRMVLFAAGPVVSIVCSGTTDQTWQFQVKLAFELPGVAP